MHAGQIPAWRLLDFPQSVASHSNAAHLLCSWCSCMYTVGQQFFSALSMGLCFQVELTNELMPGLLQIAISGGESRAEYHIPMAEIGEINDALCRYTLPHLDLQHIVQLASSCRTWHELISRTSVDHLSDSVRHALSPWGLTSNLPLLEVVEHQADLLARLRCLHGFSPRIQPLNLSNDLQSSGHDRRYVREPPMIFEQLAWSLCTRRENASHWLLLHISQHDGYFYILLDAQTGQQVQFQETCLSIQPGATFQCKFDARWLADQPCLLLHPACRHAFDPGEMCLANASTNHVSAITLPGAHREGSSRLFAAYDEKGCARDVLAWVASPVACKHFKDHIIVYDASSSGQRLYQLSCPESVVQSFMQLQSQHIGPGPGSSQRMPVKDWLVTPEKLMLSPNGDLLAIAWHVNVSAHQYVLTRTGEVQGLSIHSAIGGECKLSMVLMPGQTLPCWDDPPSWIPNSSNLMYASSNGLHVISSSGELLWSQPTSERTLDLATDPLLDTDEYHIETRTSASECGRWICVMDEIFCSELPGCEIDGRASEHHGSRKWSCPSSSYDPWTFCTH